MLKTASIAILILTPVLNMVANATRNVPGIGGECLLWIFPLLISGVIKNSLSINIEKKEK